MAGKTRNDSGRCCVCNADLCSARFEMPVYCVPCITDMERLGMGPERYRRNRKRLQS
ncbi:TPA: hypothetical protein HA231_04145 [Candidatus Woesearchaeota archaeon]|nr:hypothetical protein [Candidatus Woesearchaeota archaeon]